MAFKFSTCVRPNLLTIQPYRCARDDYEDDGTNILLDANENAYGPGLSICGDGLCNGSANHENPVEQPVVDLLGLNRYPDPNQTQLKQLFCSLRNTNTHSGKLLQTGNLFVGVGSDEAIDAILRCFCVPGHDKILTCPPTYGMYTVSACYNDLEVVEVPLDTGNGFTLRPEAINEKLSSDPTIKVVYITSPGNPTGKLISKASIETVLKNPTWNGVVVLDEAYIDFAADGSSLAQWVTEWPNLIVMQTLSKSFGLAGIRVGVAFTSLEIAKMLNILKAPYNISSPTSALACAALQPESLKVMLSSRTKILLQRERMLTELPRISGIGRFRGGSDANFLLFEILDKPREEGGEPNNTTALAAYEELAENRGVVVRFRGKERGCLGCLRVTVGTETEVDRFLREIKNVLSTIYRRKTEVEDGRTENGKQNAANGVIA